MPQCGDKPQLIAIGIAPLGIISIGIVPMGAVSYTPLTLPTNLTGYITWVAVPMTIITQQTLTNRQIKKT